MKHEAGTRRHKHILRSRCDHWRRAGVVADCVHDDEAAASEAPKRAVDVEHDLPVAAVAFERHQEDADSPPLVFGDLSEDAGRRDDGTVRVAPEPDPVLPKLWRQLAEVVAADLDLGDEVLVRLAHHSLPFLMASRIPR